MHAALLEGRIAETPWGPRLGVRWWRFGAGVLLGLAFATKWSGLYYIVFFGVMSLGFDVAARRAYRVPRPWFGVIRRDFVPDRVCVRADPLRGVPGVIRAVVLLRDRGQPPRGGPVDRRAAMVPAAGRDPFAVALHLQGVSLPLDADELRGQPPPVGVQAVDVADVAASGAVCDRQPERPRMRRRVLRQGRHAGRHPGDVVVGGAGPALRGLADVRAPGLALRRRAGRVLRGLPALVRRHRPADVLLLRGADGAVPDHGDRADPRRHPVSADAATPSAGRSG